MQATKIADTGEINRRCNEVFVMQEGDFVWGIFLTDDGQLLVEMEEINEEGESSGIFNYEPNMEERPEALAYLMGERNDFND
jgi:hypothetical protein